MGQEPDQTSEKLFKMPEIMIDAPFCVRRFARVWRRELWEKATIIVVGRI